MISNPGDIFMVGGERALTVSEFTKLIANILNVKINKATIPLYIALLHVTIFEPFLKSLKINPILTKSRLDFFTKTRTVSTKKAKKMLNYNPIKLQIGLKKTIQWYKDNPQWWQPLKSGEYLEYYKKQYQKRFK